MGNMYIRSRGRWRARDGTCNECVAFLSRNETMEIYVSSFVYCVFPPHHAVTRCSNMLTQYSISKGLVARVCKMRSLVRTTSLLLAFRFGFGSALLQRCTHFSRHSTSHTWTYSMGPEIESNKGRADDCVCDGQFIFSSLLYPHSMCCAERTSMWVGGFGTSIHHRNRYTSILGNMQSDASVVHCWKTSDAHFEIDTCIRRYIDTNGSGKLYCIVPLRAIHLKVL